MFVVDILDLKIKTRILVDLLVKITILAKYLNYTDILLSKFVVKLLEYSNCDYAIKLEEDKQLFYGLIYSLQSIILEILKAYIKINLANDFILFFKSLANAQILFD